MAVEALFFDSQSGDRIYNAADWEDIFGALFNDGIVPHHGNEMAVTQATPSDMSVVIDVGAAIINGKLFQVVNDAMSVTVGGNSSGSARHDLVVAQVDYTNRIGEIVVKPGTPGDGVPPEPEVSASVYEIALAEVFVGNGAVQIVDDDITDRRVFSTSEASLPRGTITMWSGGTSNIPLGWSLCNGTNGTPDLRDKFIVGAGAAYSTGATGGANTVALGIDHMPSHNHSGPSHNHSTPNHNHTFSDTSSTDSHNHGGTYGAGGHNHNIHGLSGEGGTGRTVIGNPNNYPVVSSTGSVGNHDHSIPTDSHNHSVSGTTSSNNGGNTGTSGTGNTGSTGGGVAHENRPPYYALAFIMKI